MISVTSKIELKQIVESKIWLLLLPDLEISKKIESQLSNKEQLQSFVYYSRPINLFISQDLVRGYWLVIEEGELENEALVVCKVDRPNLNCFFEQIKYGDNFLLKAQKNDLRPTRLDLSDFGLVRKIELHSVGSDKFLIFTHHNKEWCINIQADCSSWVSFDQELIALVRKQSTKNVVL